MRKYNVQTLLFLFILLITSPINLSAQAISIRGRVIEADSDPIISLPFSTVSISDTYSVNINYTSSDGDGRFTINVAKPGDYLLSVSYVGYEKTTINLKNLSTSTDIGDIEILESTELLNEVVVSASNIIQKIDRQIILPTDNQIKRSNDAYDLLNNMMIDRLRVNPIYKTLEVSGGNVQTRVNGIEVKGNEIASILAKDIKRIEFIENPGSRYHDTELGAVINIITKKREDGGQVSLQTSNSPHVLWGENFATARYNNRNSEWSLSYNNRNRGYKERRRDVIEKFNISDTSVERIQEGINDKSKSFYHNINLSYNLSEPEKYTFNTVFRNEIKNTPYDNRTSKLFSKGSSDYIFSRVQMYEKAYSPSLDLYYQQNLPKEQSIQFNIVGTFIDTNNKRQYLEYLEDDSDISDILSDIDGEKHSIIGEGIYDKEMGNVKFSSGIRHFQMKTKNKYKGTIEMKSDMNQSETYVFAEIQGRLKSFSYAGGIGLTRSYFKESNEKNEVFTFSPSVQLSYRPHSNSFIRYTFNVKPSIPSLGSLTNVEQAIDTIQISRGNPWLRTFGIYTNNLTYSLSIKKFNASLNARYLYYKNPIMESIFVENDRIIYMDENQEYYKQLNTELNFGINDLDLFGIPDFFSANSSLGYTYFKSKGNNYDHDYDDFYISIIGTLSYKNFMLAGQYRKYQNSLFGETIQKGTDVTMFMLAYHKDNFQAGLMLMYPFSNNYKTGYERISSVARVTSYDYVKEAGRMFVIRLSYNFEFGKKYRTGQKKLNNKDTDSGIIKIER